MQNACKMTECRSNIGNQWARVQHNAQLWVCPLFMVCFTIFVSVIGIPFLGDRGIRSCETYGMLAFFDTKYTNVVINKGILKPWCSLCCRFKRTKCKWEDRSYSFVMKRSQYTSNALQRLKCGVYTLSTPLLVHVTDQPAVQWPRVPKPRG